LQPVSVENENGNITGVNFEYTSNENGTLTSTGETLTLKADQLLRAIGQKLDSDVLEASGLELDSNLVKINEDGSTSNDKIWAGGDCATGGDDLTVSAVAMGRDAAESIHLQLTTKTDGAR
jgi:glutamate synthase (NADPH/NADH) small chain